MLESDAIIRRYAIIQQSDGAVRSGTDCPPLFPSVAGAAPFLSSGPP